MSKENKYKLTGSGSVTFETDEGNITHRRNDVIGEEAYKKVPSRQQGFFEEVDESEEAGDESEGGPSKEEMLEILQEQQKTIERLEKKVDGQEEDEKEEPSLEEQIAKEYTVEELQEALTKAEVAYNSKAKKDDLIALYIETVHEEE